MDNILVYLTDFLDFNSYSYDLNSNKKDIIFSGFEFDLSDIDNFVEPAQKHTYSLLNLHNYFVISILVSSDKVIFLVPSHKLDNYVERDFNILTILARAELLCKLVYELYSTRKAPNDKIYVDSLTSEVIGVFDEPLYLDFLALNDININIIKSILGHNKKDFYIWKSRLLKNTVVKTELTSKYSQHTLIEYTSLLTNVLTNFGYPSTDLYTIKKKIFATIDCHTTFPLNLRILDQIITLFFDLLLNKNLSSGTELHQKIKNHIDRNITQQITLPDIARNLRVPLKKLNPTFKKQYGLTINQYIRHHKINIAKNLLYATNLSLQDIAILLGFNSQSYFVTTFKEITNQTPINYRNKIQKN
ncbi:helix-turn-helix domain-containing protein [Leuconostoc mesenteroides]|uniref:helix-turn-helix domain-containing protein n=1 Tax=Leuconostoc mesenteroides TaxID=1245 RepID=UPI00068FF464|nr:AraC family transcriptional regulator [Leuconostoc mesenteroides]